MVALKTGTRLKHYVAQQEEKGRNAAGQAKGRCTGNAPRRAGMAAYVCSARAGGVPCSYGKPEQRARWFCTNLATLSRIYLHRPWPLRSISTCARRMGASTSIFLTDAVEAGRADEGRSRTGRRLPA